MNEKTSRQNLYADISKWARMKQADRLRQKYAPKSKAPAAPASGTLAGDGLDADALTALESSLSAPEGGGV